MDLTEATAKLLDLPKVYTKAKKTDRRQNPSARAAHKATKPKAKKVAKRPAKVVVRSERMDLRLSKSEKAAIKAKAKKLRRTLTSLFVEFVEKLK